MFKNNTILYVGQCQGYDVMLLEVFHSHILPDSDKLIKLLLNNNSRPLIPTTRAIKKIMADPSKIQPFIDQDCLLQVTTGSLVGCLN
jgi:protein-tyrosine phosphatase